MKLQIKKGTTSKSLYVFIQDSSATTGAGLTGLVHDSAGLSAYYVRPLGNATSISLVTQTVTGAYSSGGFVEVSSANMPGVYRFDIPDACLASGVDSVVVMLKGATNMAMLPLEIMLVAYDPQDATNLGLSQIGAIETDTQDIQSRLPAALTGAGNMKADMLAIDGGTQSAADLKDFADAGYDPATHKVEGVKLVDTLTTYTGNTPQSGDSYARIGANGSGLGDIPWNSDWDVEVQSEVNDALVAYDVVDNTDLDARTILAADYATSAEIDALNNLSASDVEDAVWDASLASHQDAGSTGAALNAASSAGDPWNTNLPGAYAAGTAGYIVGTNLNATVSSRLASASYTAPDNATISTINTNLNGLITDIGANGSGLTAIPWNSTWDDDVQNACYDALSGFQVPTVTQLNARTLVSSAYATATALSTVNTSVVAIKERTDNLPNDPASSQDVENLLTTQLVESYAADGVAPTLTQALMLTMQAFSEFSITGTTITVKGLNGLTTAATYTLNSATEPTSRTRTT